MPLYPSNTSIRRPHPVVALIFQRLLSAWLFVQLLRFPHSGGQLLSDYHWQPLELALLLCSSLLLGGLLIYLDLRQSSGDRTAEAKPSAQLLGGLLSQLKQQPWLAPERACLLVYRLALLFCLLACYASQDPAQALFFLFLASLAAALEQQDPRARGSALPRWGLGLGLVCFCFQLLRSGLQGSLGLFLAAYERIYAQAPLAFLTSLGLALIISLLWQLFQERHGKGSQSPSPAPLWRRLLPLLFGLCAFGLLSFFLLARSLTLHSPAFDHGIFHQAYGNMLRGLGPLSSFERDQVLSHFAVHISPSLYLLLPFYALWPSSVGVQALQLLCLVLGLIPLRLLLRRLELPRSQACLLQLLYLFFPALLCSTGYDFHENALLAPLLLALAWALTCRRPIWTLLFCLACLGVKEDAFLYVFFLALFALFARRHLDQLFFRQEQAVCSSRLFSLVQAGLPLLALLYFALCLSLLQNQGDGAMTYRFSNLFLDERLGLLSIPLGLLQEPVTFLSFAAQAAKLGHLSFFVLGLAGLILRPSRPAQLFLYAPLFLMNLLSNYGYQFNIRFQYNFGSGVLLFFLLLLLLAERQSLLLAAPTPARIRRRQEQTLQARLLFALCFGLFFSGSLLYEFGAGPHFWQEHSEAQRILGALESYRGQEVPSLASHNLCSALLPNNQLYLLSFHQGEQEPVYDPQIQRLFFDLRYEPSPRETAWEQLYRARGYEAKELAGGLLLVLEAPEQSQ